MKQTLEEKQEEQQRLLKNYNRIQRANWAKLCEEEPRLVPFKKALKRSEDPLKLIFDLADCWVRFAQPHIQRAVTSLILEHTEKQKVKRGGRELDDPMWPNVNCYIVARRLFPIR